MLTTTHTLALFGSLGPWEIGIILVVGVLIFGKRLPEVGRNVGKSFVEFKKGLAGATDEINKAKQEADRVAHQADTTIDTGTQDASVQEETAATEQDKHSS